MKIFLNNENISVESNSTLFHLLENRGFAEKSGIAVAINNTVIGKPSWKNEVLNENDRVLIISATKGG